jgi:hypothetical protein
MFHQPDPRFMRFASTGGRYIARFLACVILPSFSVLLIALPTGATAATGYNNANIATKALQYVGQWGGNACRDAHKPGDSGGQCRAFVNCIVWMVSGHTQNLGGRDYYQPFLAAGGRRITSVAQLSEGDIVQVGEGTHTFIIVAPISITAAGVGTFSVVDSNHEYNERVMHYNRTFSLSNTTRAYRMGAIPAAKTPAPAPSSQPAQTEAAPPAAAEPAPSHSVEASPKRPVFTVMNTSETLPDGIWFRTAPYMADTERITGLGPYMNEQVELLCYQFGEAVGPYSDRLWYQTNDITRPTINGRPNTGYLNAHFINDGKIANETDPGVPSC